MIGMTTSQASEAVNLLETLSLPKRSSALATLSGEVTVLQILGTSGVKNSAGKGRFKPYLTSGDSGEKTSSDEGRGGESDDESWSDHSEGGELEWERLGGLHFTNQRFLWDSSRIRHRCEVCGSAREDGATRIDQSHREKVGLLMSGAGVPSSRNS